MNVAVLALQGGFAAHQAALARRGHRVTLARTAAALDAQDALVLPGGESTTMLRLLERDPALRAALDAFAANGRPVLATCAGLILVARAVLDPAQASLGWLDVTVQRNGWGRQVASFEALADDGVTPLLAIRAPRITAVGPRAHVVTSYRGEPVVVRQGAITGCTVHPELTDDALGWLAT